MKLYLISRTDDWGYDEFDSFVVAAESEENAFKLYPAMKDSADDGFKYSNYGWTFRENLKIECIGESYSKEEKVIISSFNAG